MKEQILARHAQGAALVGISAGAIQLGRYAVLNESDSTALELLDVFNLAPAMIDVHDERDDWGKLSSTVRLLEGATVGIGIPTGGGIVVHPDGAVEALRHVAHEISWDGTRLVRSLLVPLENAKGA
jgi:cyanophycinase